MTAPRVVLITADGQEYRLRFGDISAMDAKDFRSKVGISLAKALDEGSTDLDVVAGLIWLVRRRTEGKGLPYERVAKALNYETDLGLVEEADAETDAAGVDDTDPET